MQLEYLSFGSSSLSNLQGTQVQLYVKLFDALQRAFQQTSYQIRKEKHK